MGASWGDYIFHRGSCWILGIDSQKLMISFFFLSRFINERGNCFRALGTGTKKSRRKRERERADRWRKVYGPLERRDTAGWQRWWKRNEMENKAQIQTKRSCTRTRTHKHTHTYIHTHIVINYIIVICIEMQLGGAIAHHPVRVKEQVRGDMQPEVSVCKHFDSCHIGLTLL